LVLQPAQLFLSIISMVRMPKRPTVPIQGQITVLSKDFPDGSVINQTTKHLVWETDVVPTANSSTYRIRIDYTLDNAPKVYVIKPEKLKLADGQEKLPHVFCTPSQQICLFYPGFKEWLPSMFLARTIVPWASEWLLFYELWLITGEWQGGGIDHTPRKQSFGFSRSESDEKE